VLECHLRRFKDVDVSASFRFYGIGDVHAGNKHVQVDKLDSTIEKVQEDPGAYWFGLGDLGDWIAFSDRRFEEYEMADWIDISDPWMSTIDWLGDKFSPIADKCLGLVPGNHEMTVAKRYHMHVHKHVCARLGVVDLGPMAFYRTIFHYCRRRRAFDFFLTHGWGGGRTSGARANKLEQLMRDNHARVYMIGHVHGQLPILNSAVRRITSKNRLAYERRVGVVSGTYLLDAEYERRFGCAPSVIGSPMISLEPFKGNIMAVLE
jgi:hypothetical protein